MDVPVANGQAFLPGSSAAHPARLMRTASGRLLLADESGTVLSECAGKEVTAEPRIGQAESRVIFPDGALFLTFDHAAAGTLAGRDPAAGLLHRLETFHPRLALFALLCLGGGWLLWRHGLGAMAAAAVWLTPAPVLDAIDTGTLASLDLKLTRPSGLSDDEKYRVQRIFRDLDGQLRQQGADLRLKLEFRAMPGFGANAFAMPGGTIVLTDAFVRMADRDQIAGVIGHEIAHVERNHGLTQFYRAGGAFLMISMMAGDTGPVLEDLLLEGNLLLSLRHSRAHELEADAFGRALADDAGYDPDGLLRFFAALQAESGSEPPAWLSTHPAFDHRIKALNSETR